MLRVLMVEDDATAAASLRSLIERYAASRGIDFCVAWLKTAFEFISAGGKYDLVFMDIDLPGINGMEAAELLRSYDAVTPLIFVTNLAQYAVRGYEVDALDFIVKPVRYRDFSMRMDRAMRKIATRADRPVVISGATGMRVIPLTAIEYIESANHDLLYHLSNEEEPLRTRGKLSDVESEGAPLLRVSKSCVVNMDHIRSMRGEKIMTFGGAELRISRSRKRECADTVARYLGGSL